MSRPSFVSQKIFSKNFVAIHRIKPVLRLNKPIYAVFSVLQQSKLLMYEFHYKYIKKKSDAKLLITDTDSLVYEIKKKKNFMKTCLILVIIHCTQSFLIQLSYWKMKDEFKGKIISEFVRLKSNFR